MSPRTSAGKRTNSKESASPAFPPGMSQPAIRALATVAVTKLDQLTQHREADLARLHGMGPKGIAVLKAALEKEGKQFRE